MSVDLERAQAAVRELLLAVGEDPDRPGLRETPDRVARAAVELFVGYDENPAAHLRKQFHESDNEETSYTRLDAKTYLFEGKTHLGDFERILDLDEGTFSDVKGEAETLAGLMLELKRDFPRKGDVFTAHDIRFTVQEMDGHRIEKIRVDLP